MTGEMISARDDILARIRRANHGVDHSVAAPLDHPIPARAQGQRAELVARFVAMAAEASATVSRVGARAEIPAAIAAFLVSEDLPPEIRVAPDARLADLPWGAAPDLARSTGRARPGDRVSLTPAFAGIAETGTLMVHSGPDTPNTLHFLPETHIALLAGDDIVGGYEDAWARLSARFDRLPRSVTLITGPSRSSDIERKPQIGVHGPRRLHIVLVDGEET
jgi:L-lactate dehydrogenase complex protein LldG